MIRVEYTNGEVENFKSPKKIRRRRRDIYKIDAQNCGLTSLKGFPRFRTFPILDVSHNKLETLEGCPKVLQLYANGNDLRTLKGLGDRKRRLRTLYVDDNYLTSLRNLPYSVREISAKNNYIKSLYGLPDYVQKLNLEYNLMMSVSNPPSQLNEFKLKGNSLDLKSFSDFNPKNLEFLDIRENWLTSEESKKFKNLARNVVSD